MEQKIILKNTTDKLIILEIEPLLEQIEIYVDSEVEILCSLSNFYIDIQKDGFISLNDTENKIQIIKENHLIYETKWR